MHELRLFMAYMWHCLWMLFYGHHSLCLWLHVLLVVIWLCILMISTFHTATWKHAGQSWCGIVISKVLIIWSFKHGSELHFIIQLTVFSNSQAEYSSLYQILSRDGWVYYCWLHYHSLSENCSSFGCSSLSCTHSLSSSIIRNLICLLKRH